MQVVFACLCCYTRQLPKIEIRHYTLSYAVLQAYAVIQDTSLPATAQPGQRQSS